MAKSGDKQTQAAAETFRRHGGILTTSEALSQGIHRRTLCEMREAGTVERLERLLNKRS